jgi:very-short-patch-repair endonuclease
MKIWLFMAAILAVLALLGFVLSLRKKEAGWEYYAKKPMTKPEQVLYFRLIDALPDHVILAQVQLSRFLGVKKGCRNYMGSLARISRLSADFLVCTKDAGIVAVIELDDASHEGKKNKANDIKKDKAIQAARLRVIRWHVGDMPTNEKIKQDVIKDTNG